MKERLRTHKKIERYREEKLKRELESLEQIKERERRIKELHAKQDQRRKEYLEKQKDKLEEYHRAKGKHSFS